MGLFTSESKSEREVTPYRPEHMFDWTNRMFELSQRPMEAFPEQTYAGMTPEQLAALESRMGVAEGFGGGIMTPTIEAWRSTLTAPDVAANPYVNAMLDVQRGQAAEALREDIFPMIRSHAVGAGALGGSRQGVAERGAIEETMDALTQAQAQTQLGAYGQGLAQQRYGIGAAPGMVGLELAPTDIMMGVGEARRAEEQRAIDEARWRHEFEQQEPWQRLERFAGTYMPATMPFAKTETTQQTDPSVLQIGSQLAGLALTGAMGAGALGFGPAAGMFSGAGGGGVSSGIMTPGAGGGGGNPWARALTTNIAADMAIPEGWGLPSSGYGMPSWR